MFLKTPETNKIILNLAALLYLANWYFRIGATQKYFRGFSFLLTS